MKQFFESDVSNSDSLYPRIYLGDYHKELLYDPPDWMKLGLQQTASGYGKKLNSGMKIHFDGRLYRIYTTIFSNAGTSWFTVKGRTIYVS